MYLLSLCIIAVVVILLIPRVFGDRQGRMLKQYETLEKRFGFSHRIAQSKWGKGIGEHHSLVGEYRGYPFSVYSHYVKDGGRKRVWTSLVAEVLFVGEAELCIEFKDTQQEATFSAKEELAHSRVGDGWRASSDLRDILSVLEEPAFRDRLLRFATKGECGAIRLSKGFIEYRETGRMESDMIRLRFQEAMLLLGDFADSLSLYAGRKSVKSEPA